MTAKKYLVLLAGAMLATGAVAGGDKDHSMKSADQKFDQLDQNQDESISKAEASKDETLSATFASVDSNGDGELSKTEYTAQLSDSESGSDWTSPSDSPSEE